MTITKSEFKLNPDKYLVLAENEDICTPENGKSSVKLVGNRQEKVEAMQSLFGCIPEGMHECNLPTNQFCYSD